MWCKVHQTIRSPSTSARQAQRGPWEDQCEMRRKAVAHLGDEQLAGCQLPLTGIHLPVGIHLGALKLLAAVHQGLDLWLHLADVQAGHGELLFNDSIHICQLKQPGMLEYRLQKLQVSATTSRGSLTPWNQTTDLQDVRWFLVKTFQSQGKVKIMIHSTPSSLEPQMKRPTENLYQISCSVNQIL